MTVKVTKKNDIKTLWVLIGEHELVIDVAVGENADYMIQSAYDNFVFGWNLACINNGHDVSGLEYNLETQLKNQALNK